VKNFLQRSRTASLEGELVAQRPAPREDFVAALTRTIGAHPRQGRNARFGAAIAMAGVALVALSAGQAGYAYSSTSTPAKKASGVHLNQSARIQGTDSSSHAQYGPTPKPKPKPKPTPKHHGQPSGLPFTGLSLFVPVVVGVGFMLIGVLLRRRGRATPQ